MPKVTIPYVEQKFEEFNQLMFAGELPKLPIELSDAKTFLGMCVYKRRRTLWGRTEYYGFKLRINTRIDLPEAEVEDISRTRSRRSSCMAPNSGGVWWHT